MLRNEMIAAVHLALQVSGSDNSYDPEEHDMLHRLCGLLGVDPVRDLSPAALSEVDPYAAIVSQEGLSLAFIMMAAVAAADGILQDEEFTIITGVIARFRDRIPGAVAKLEERICRDPGQTVTLILANVLRLAPGDAAYRRLEAPLEALCARMRTALAGDGGGCG